MENLNDIMGSGRITRLQDKSGRQSAKNMGTSSGEQKPLSDDQTMAWLWQVLSGMYGHKWVSSYGARPDPDGAWSATLAGVTAEQMRAGLRACADRSDQWPPTAPEFKALCKPKRHACHQPFEPSVPLIEDHGKYERSKASQAKFKNLAQEQGWIRTDRGSGK